MYTGPSPNRRQEHQDQNHREILNHEPTDGDATVECFQNVTVFEGTEQHHCAGDRQGEAEGNAGDNIPSFLVNTRTTESSGDRDLDDGAWQSDMANSEKLFERKVQSDTEHQQHDADFGKLMRQIKIGNETRRCRTDDNSGNQISDQGRQLEANCDKAHREREAEGSGDGGD